MGHRPESGEGRHGHGPGQCGVLRCQLARVDLPHDWAIELPFDAKADIAHGCKAIGEAFRKTVLGVSAHVRAAAADSGQRLWLEFDGVFRDCTVFVNGLVRRPPRERLHRRSLRHHGRGQLRRKERGRRAGGRFAIRRLVYEARASTATSGW